MRRDGPARTPCARPDSRSTTGPRTAGSTNHSGPTSPGASANAAPPHSRADTIGTVAAGALFFHRVVVPTPFKVGPANVYVFTDGPVTLIDCGPNTSAAENALRLGLAEHGLHLEQIARIIVTHAHPDHYGLAPRIRAISGCDVRVGEFDLPKIAGTAGMAATGPPRAEA